jgi:hypothetical protein
MYQASSRASAGVAIAVEASAITTASFRIIIPFPINSLGRVKAY